MDSETTKASPDRHTDARYRGWQWACDNFEGKASPPIVLDSPSERFAFFGGVDKFYDHRDYVELFPVK